jgi:hypothetical protein
VTHEHVLLAIREFDDLGAVAFHKKYGYGYGDTVRYFIHYEGREYPAKGIFGVAHTLGLGEKLETLSGGTGLNPYLEQLGFEVVDHSPELSSVSTVPQSLFLVPASSDAARENFARSVAQPVPSETYRNVAPPEFLVDSGVAESHEPLFLWGCFAGGARERTWEQLSPGDFIVFVQGGRFVAVSQVVAKARASALSHAIWREDESEPFELVYSLTRPDQVDIAQTELSDWLPSLVRGFMRLGTDREAAIVHQFGSIENFVNEKLLGKTPDPITWWVNQGFTYLQERDGGYLWAPQHAKDGGPRPYWTTMTEAKPGDRIVHYKDSAIRAVSRASSAAEDAIRPGELPEETWGQEGWLLRSAYEELAQPIPLNSFDPSWLRPTSGPFDITGRAKQGYLFRVSDDFGRELARMIDQQQLAPPQQGSDDTLGGLMRWTHLSREDLEELIELLKTRRQVILHGPPGSGKTWVAEALARYLTDNPLESDETNGRLELVQFHQSYGYEDFMQGIRPVTSDDGRLEYRVLPGILMRFIEQDGWDRDLDYVLVIDEINRGNISRIFGELLLLLEYRGKQVRLPYAEAGAPKFRLPPNLLIIGTMNTAEPIASLD